MNNPIIATWAQISHPHIIETLLYVLIVFGATKGGWFNKGWKFSIHLLLMPFLLIFLKVGLIENIILLIVILPALYILLVLPYKQIINQEKLNKRVQSD